MKQNKSALILVILLLIALGVIGYFVFGSKKPTDMSTIPDELLETESGQQTGPITPTSQDSAPQSDNLTRESYQNQAGFMTGYTVKPNGDIIATIDLVSRNSAYSDLNPGVGSPWVNNQTVLKRFLITSQTKIRNCSETELVISPFTDNTVNTPAAFAKFAEQVYTQSSGQPHVQFDGRLLFEMQIQNGVINDIQVNCPGY